MFPIPLSSPAPPEPPPASASHQLFDALNHARFDQVRRAVAAGPSVLTATAAPRSAHFVATRPTPRFTPVDYALNNCRIWEALIEHCQRTGSTIQELGYLTFRERLAAMDVIVTWLLQHPETPQPVHAPLHIALSCRYEVSFAKLLELYPTLVHSLDARGKTPLHVCCALPERLPPSQAARYVRMLADAGANMDAQDADGRTALHDLVSALNVSTPAYGLVRRRQQARSLMSVLPIVNELLTNGASIFVEDARGDTPLDVALASGVDYVVFTMQANWVFEQICGAGLARQYLEGDKQRSFTGGPWDMLPEDIVLRIFRLLSPREVVTGVGATCHALRRIAVSKHLWSRYTSEYTMAVVRMSLRRRGSRHPSVRR